MRSFVGAALALIIGITTADTNVSVIECGSGGTVRSAVNNRDGLGTTVADVGSFWSHLHNFHQARKVARKNRRAHRGGFSMVADHFNKPAGGIAISLVGEAVNLDHFPKLSAYLKSSESVVGSFHMTGSQSGLLETIVGGEKNVLELGEVVEVIKNKVHEIRVKGENVIESVEINIDDKESASDVDGKLPALLESLSNEDDKTVVLHLIVDETAESRRRLTQRRLEDDKEEEDNKDEEEDNKEEEEEEENKDEEENNENGNNNDDAYYAKQSSSFYGYGYYDENGVWQTNYRSIFQIQYYNTVLWTSVGLFSIMFTSVLFMMNMPLMPDTLLFGESAKMIGE